MNLTSTAPEKEFQDRSRWLVLVGLAEIFIGCLCGLIGLLLPIVSRYFQQNPGEVYVAGDISTVLNVGMFLALALLFVLLGAGTIKGRRWARDLMLITAWIWLTVGVLTIALLIMILPSQLSRSSISGQDTIGGSELALIMTTYLVLVGLAYIVLPGLLVLLYSGRNVRMTFERRDPRPRWTGKCPLSVLTASQFLAGGAVTLGILLIYSPELPLFGRVVTGVSARLILIAATLLSAYLTWATYKLKPHSWWLSICFSALSLVWFVGSRSHLGLARRIEGEGFSLQLDDKTLSSVVVTLGIIWMIFLIIIKKHFRRSAPPGDSVQ